MSSSRKRPRAAVRVAEDYGTYVATHVFNPVGIKRSLNAGVKTIEHGHLIDEEAMELLAEKEAILSTQVYVMAMLKPIYTDAVRAGKLKQALDGMDNMFKLAKKYKVKIVYGTDLLFDYEGRKDQLKDLTAQKAVVHLCGDHDPGHRKRRRLCGAVRQAKYLRQGGRD